VSPTKQAKSNSGKETKLHQVTEWRKNLGRNHAGSVGGPMNEQCMIIIQAAFQVRSQIGSEHSIYFEECL